MEQDRWRQVDQIFHDLIDQTPEQRASFLDRLCADDPSLKKEVEQLIEAYQRSGGFLDSPAAAYGSLIGRSLGSYGTTAALSTVGTSSASNAMKDEVEALLEHHERQTDILERSVGSVSVTLPPGTVLGPYEIIEVAGTGGMGQVYRARDGRLKRDVAIKTLPIEFASDSARRSRFEREATVLASLNHPNIGAIHDVVEAGAGPYLILEFVEGRTLAERLHDGPLPIDEVLHLCSQIAVALEAAHDQGIVHRDLKPANLKVTPGGKLKVLDFGLAKTFSRDLAEPDLGPSSTPADTRLEYSVIPGTPAYMSPEQTRGHDMDQRTDIWSFGCVMYELLTGRRPFQGETVPQIIVSIQETEPDWTLLLNESESAVQTLLLTCLQKDANQRFQHARELRKAIEEIEAKCKSASAVGPSEKKQRFWAKWALVSAITLVAGGAGIFGFNAVRGRPEFSVEETRQLTFAPELEVDPSLSPDGKMLAYARLSKFAWDTPGGSDIYVQQVSGSEPVNLTKNLPGFHRWPRWSPDGTLIAFVSTVAAAPASRPDQPTFVIRIVPYLGGAPRQIVDSAMLGHAWSPDGKKLAYIRGNEIWVAALDGSPPHKIAAAFEPSAPSWSPDSKWIVFVSGNPEFTFSLLMGNTAPSAIAIVPADGGTPWRVTDKLATSVSPVWAPDSKSLFFVSNRDRGGAREVFQLKLSDSGQAVGQPLRLTSGLNAFAIDLSRDGRALAYSTFLSKTNLWSLPIPESGPVSAAGAKSVTTGSQEIESASVSRDGKWIAFDSYRGGQQDIFRMLRTGGDPERLTTNPADDSTPSWSPDGKFIAFHSHRNGNRDIYVISADGSSEQQVTRDPAEERFADWSPDGQRLVFWSDKNGRNELFIVSKENGRWGEPRQLTTDGSAIWPRWSPDGRFIAYIAYRPDGGLSLISTDGRNRQLLVPSRPDREPSYVSWSKDSRTLYFRARTRGGQSRASIFSVPVTGGEPKQLVLLPESTLRNEFINDGANYLFTMTERESNVWMLKLRK